MKKVMLILVALMCTTAFGVIGDSWDLADDMATTAGNPNGPWKYWQQQGATGIPANRIAMDSATGAVPGPIPMVNWELPDEGIGWYMAAAPHHTMIKFTVDADDGDNTLYKAGEVGGHSYIGVEWTAPADGTYLVDYSGFNARRSGGWRNTELVLMLAEVEVDRTLIEGLIDDGFGGEMPGANSGSENAYTNSTIINLLAGDTVVLEHAGNDWVGFGLTIEEIPEPATMLLLGLGSLVAIRRKK